MLPAIDAARLSPRRASRSAPARFASFAVRSKRPGLPAVVDLAEEAEPGPHHDGQPLGGDRAAGRESCRRARLVGRQEQRCRRAGARGRVGCEDEREHPARLVPDRDRRVGEQRRRVHRERRPGEPGHEPCGPPKPRKHAERLARRRRGGRAAARGEQPAPDAHRRGDLEHAQHVQEALGTAEVADQKRRADQLGGQADREARACETPIAGAPGGETEHRRRACETARERVQRDLGLPDRLLQDRAAVVGAGSASRLRRGRRHRPPPTAASTPATSAPAASAAVAHMRGSSRVVTTGSGGSP